jgi:hypothetical protein
VKQEVEQIGKQVQVKRAGFHHGRCPWFSSPPLHLVAILPDASLAANFCGGQSAEFGLVEDGPDKLSVIGMLRRAEVELAQDNYIEEVWCSLRLSEQTYYFSARAGWVRADSSPRDQLRSISIPAARARA